MRRHTGKYVETELGRERICYGCGEPWPFDPEFFYRQPTGHGGLQGMCKACKHERRRRDGRQG